MFNQTFTVNKQDYQNAGKVSSQIKQIFKEIQIDPIVIRKMAVASYEAEINMIIHSEGGVVELRVDNDNVQLNFKDVGPGIKDLTKALSPGYSTADDKAREFGFGAGMGLPNMQRVADEFDIESSSKGTSIMMKFNL